MRIEFDNQRGRWVLLIAGTPAVQATKLETLTRKWPHAKVVQP